MQHMTFDNARRKLHSWILLFEVHLLNCQDFLGHRWLDHSCTHGPQVDLNKQICVQQYFIMREDIIVDRPGQSWILQE